MDDVRLLDLLVKDVDRQIGIYRPGPYWDRPAAFAAKEMRKYGISQFRSSRSGLIGQGYTDSITLDPTFSWVMGNLPRRILKKFVDSRLVRRWLIKAFDVYILGQQLHINGIEGQLIRTLHEERLITNGLLEKLPDTLYGGGGIGGSDRRADCVAVLLEHSFPSGKPFTLN